MGTGDPSKAAKLLDWKAEVRMEEVVRRMAAAEKERTT
jgi:GDP-D-mannose dehydratase